MSAIVDYSYYSTVYMGTEADETSFPALCARALDVVGAMTRWAITEGTMETTHPQIQTLYRKAVCAQIDYFAVNGFEAAVGGTPSGFTVGKVSVAAKSTASAHTGAMANAVAPLAIMYLEQTGLMYPGAPVAAGGISLC